MLFPFSHDGRALSVFALDPTANPNFLALFLVPIAAFTLAQLTDLQKQQFILWPALLLNFIAIVLSRSRGGILGLTLGILFVLLTRFKKNLWGRVGIVVIVMLVVTGIYRSLPNLAATPNSGRIASSNNIRYEIWKTTREMLASPKPIFVGFGLGNYQQTFTEFTKDRVNYPEFIAPEALTPHNLVLALWANGGLLMVMSFIWLIVVAFKKRGGLAAQSALIALLGHGLVDTPYFKNDLSVLFWIIIVLIMISGKYDTA
ncbi:O-antigen ligase family protein [Candidatus Berkelbacteria bacterium]|nr:O-antigen ligase family protein [Candidatus Berkelbacteria bacterium]